MVIEQKLTARLDAVAVAAADALPAHQLTWTGRDTSSKSLQVMLVAQV